MDRSVSLIHARCLWRWHVEAEAKVERATSSDWTKGFDAGQGTAYYVALDLILSDLGMTFDRFIVQQTELGFETPPCDCIHCRGRKPGRSALSEVSSES